MSEAILGIVAVVLLLLFSMFAVSRTTGGRTYFNLDDSIEAVLFGVAFMLVASPFILIWLGIRKAWSWYKYEPPPPPPPLPVEGDDPVWGRNVNRKLAEEAFTALRLARMKRDPNIARDFISEYLYGDLKYECDGLIARHEVNTREDIQLKEIVIHDENIDDQKMSGGEHSINWFFHATIRGTMTNYVAGEEDGRITAGSPDPQEFEEKMGFVRGPEPSDHWKIIWLPGLPPSKDRAEKLERIRGKRRSGKAAHSSP
jgi:hypothetical protein